MVKKDQEVELSTLKVTHKKAIETLQKQHHERITELTRQNTNLIRLNEHIKSRFVELADCMTRVNGVAMSRIARHANALGVQVPQPITPDTFSPCYTDDRNGRYKMPRFEELQGDSNEKLMG